MSIPGYYFDDKKQRYFKIENSRTAPDHAAWSSDHVKRRKLHDADAAAIFRYRTVAKARIKRAGVLHEPLTGGFFAREYGAARADMQAACYVAGLVNKGFVPILAAHQDGAGQQVRNMYIGTIEERPDICTMYAVTGDMCIVSTYSSRDKDKRLDQSGLSKYRSAQNETPPYVEGLIPCISDIKYHAPSNLMLIASRHQLIGTNSRSLWTMQAAVSDDPREDPLRPPMPVSAFSGPPNGHTITSPDGGHEIYEAHCVAPAPASSPFICALGMSHGVVVWDPNVPWARPSWLTPSAASARALPHNKDHDPKKQRLFKDVFAVDFHPRHGEVFRFGGRPGVLFTADTRVPAASWSHLKLPSSIAHIKCLDGGSQNHVLVAGLMRHMGVYDLRFSHSRRGAEDVDLDSRVDFDDDSGGGWSNSRGDKFKDKGKGKSKQQQQHHQHRHRKNKQTHYYPPPSASSSSSPSTTSHTPTPTPIIKFESYSNEARINIGFAYDGGSLNPSHSAGAGGVIAVAQDDAAPGTVALFSLRTGSLLRVLDLHPGRRMYKRDPFDVEHEVPPVIQCLQFQTLGGDHTPTLFVGGRGRGVGVGGGVRPRCGVTAFAFGVEDGEDEE